MIPYWQVYAFGGVVLALGLLGLWKGQPLTGIRLLGTIAILTAGIVFAMTATFQLMR